MRKLFILLGLSVFFLACQNEQPKQENAQPNQDQAVAAAVEEFKTAIVDADRAALERLLSDDLVFAHSGGKIQNKQECIDEIVSLTPNDYTNVDISNQSIKVSGNSAVVHHTYAADFTSNGQSGSLRVGVMLVWQKINGEWILLARQAFRIA
jgi:ketosteroid isomerase-like protein